MSAVATALAVYSAQILIVIGVASLAAAIVTLRITPDCADCHQALRAQLWRALLRPLPQVARRNAPDAMGQRYLDALEATP